MLAGYSQAELATFARILMESITQQRQMGEALLRAAPKSKGPPGGRP